MDLVIDNYKAPFDQKLRAVQTFVNSHVTYEPDNSTSVQDVRRLMVEKMGDSMKRPSQQLTARQISPMDTWQTSVETFVRTKGDCEDYAELKRKLLIAMGVPRDHIFFVVGHGKADENSLPKTKTGEIDEKAASQSLQIIDKKYYGGHATLVVTDGAGKAFNLDNFGKPEEWSHIAAVSEGSDQFLPEYAFSEDRQENPTVFHFESDGAHDPLSKLRDTLMERYVTPGKSFANPAKPEAPQG